MTGSSFQKLQSFNSEFSPHSFTEYISSRTGMRLIVVDQEGPKVIGQFALATEIHDDSGAPHTLEHLCFTGSKRYPYKGLLDKVATRNYSTTNAWTGNDQTVYTLETTGIGAFLTVLPIYLDHLIAPTLTDEACLTEVHHVNGKGLDAGVVYAEMQAYENDADNSVEVRTSHLVYPEGNGHRYETGGMLGPLRVLKSETIRNFHKLMYQPRNMCLIITGKLDHSELLKVLDSFEDTVVAEVPQPTDPFKRPWIDSDQVQEIEKTIIETIEFPDEDESIGQLRLSFLGPNCTDPVGSVEYDVLSTYLTGSSAAILQNIIVEKEHLASFIGFDIGARIRSLLQINVEGVQSSQLESVEKRVMELLLQVSSDAIDMSYMKECIARQQRKMKYQVERQTEFFMEEILETWIYDPRENGSSRLRDTTGTLKAYDSVGKYGNEEWQSLVRKWFLDAHHISILAKPSKAMVKRLKAEEKERIATRKKKLGSQGLADLQRALDDAEEVNNRPIPAAELDKYITKDPRISFIDSSTAIAGPAKAIIHPSNAIQQILDKDSSNNDPFLYFEHIPSNFARVGLVLGTSIIPPTLRPLLNLFMENFFSAPLQRGSQVIPFEDVVKEIEKDTTTYSIRGADGYSNPEMIVATITIEVERYSCAISWLKTLLHDSVFDADRLKTLLDTDLAGIPAILRDAFAMNSNILLSLQQSQDSFSRSGYTLGRFMYYKWLKQQLETNPREIIGQLEQIRSLLSQSSNTRTFVFSNVEKLSHPVSSWQDFFPNEKRISPPFPKEKIVDFLSPIGLDPGNTAIVTQISATDTSFLNASAKCQIPYTHSLYPAITVTLAYLVATEGPMWTGIRGPGLAYGAFWNHGKHHVTFTVYRAPDAVKAFAAAKAALEDHLSGKIEISNASLEGAVASVVSDIADNSVTIGHAAEIAFIRQIMRDLQKDWADELLQKIKNVTVEDILGIIEEQLMPVFKPEKANVVVTCPVGAAAKVCDDLEGMGFDPKERALKSFYETYGLDIDLGREEDEEEDDEEEDDEEEDDEEEDDEEDASEDGGDDSGSDQEDISSADEDDDRDTKRSRNR